MITVAYIGFGVSVREYHIPYVEGREDIRVKYVFRREEDIPAFAEFEPFYPEITFTTDLDLVLKDPEVDLVVVNTPDRFHVPYAKQILNAGKHALVEKPFAPTAAEAREVFALAKEKGFTTLREMFMYALQRTNEIVNSYGKIMMIWNADLRHGYLPDWLDRNILVHY